MDADIQKKLQDMALFPEMNPGAVCRMELDGTVLLANKAARELFDGDVAGKSWLKICPGMTDQLWKSIVRGGKRISHEADFGEHIIQFTHVFPESHETIFAYGADVTELRKAQREVAEIARFPEMNPGPVLRLNDDGIVLLANEASRKIFGDDVIGKSWFDMNPDVDDSFWTHIHKNEVPFPLESAINGNVYVFNHRVDSETSLVFVFGADITEHKHVEQALHQSEKMATLGTLAAGVAHELNNPAAAAKRAADQLRAAITKHEIALLKFDVASLNDHQRQVMQHLEQRAKQAATEPIEFDPLHRSDMEAEIEQWLDDHDVQGAWELAPNLVAQGLTKPEMDKLEHVFKDDMLELILSWAANTYPVYRLMYEISQGSSRISEIVGAMKGYAYVGQAPVRMIDIHEGIDNTLVILRNKLKSGVVVKRDYDDNLPNICAFASELNQVWTNLLDNAIDAVLQNEMKPGEIGIVTRREGEWAVVEISDNGSGIPADVVKRVFDPFFTTKAPGKGTGLGLSTTYSIVKEKHKGEIAVRSKPGHTVFTVRLLIENPTLMKM